MPSRVSTMASPPNSEGNIANKIESQALFACESSIEWPAIRMTTVGVPDAQTACSTKVNEASGHQHSAMSRSLMGTISRFSGLE